MTAAHDDRSIVRAQQSLASIAYSTQGGRTLNRKQQRQRDQIVEAISVDTVMADTVMLVGTARLSVESRGTVESIAELWEVKAREKLVGSGIAASILWSLFYQWVLPMLLEWAERWLRDQIMNQPTIVTAREKS